MTFDRKATLAAASLAVWGELTLYRPACGAWVAGAAVLALFVRHLARSYEPIPPELYQTKRMSLPGLGPEKGLWAVFRRALAHAETHSRTAVIFFKCCGLTFLCGLLGHFIESPRFESVSFLISMTFLGIAVVFAMASLALHFREERRLERGED